MKKSIQRGCYGVTLLELLVSIAILTTLLALLFAGTRKIRASSDSTKCVNNLRVIGAGIFAYVGDHNGKLLPRNLGLYREEKDREPSGQRTWTSRLYNLRYIESLDTFYCPSFFPRKAKNATKPLTGNTGAETYGMRMWLPPGAERWSSAHPLMEEHKPLVAIETPSDFFLLVDNLWLHPSYQSPGYGISPQVPEEQAVHLRHNKNANALFADGHVAPKPRAYFEQLGERQRNYTAGLIMNFGIVEEVDFDR